eukprot:1146320-Pelagomonas_calceolata.AAC.2
MKAVCVHKRSWRARRAWSHRNHEIQLQTAPHCNPPVPGKGAPSQDAAGMPSISGAPKVGSASAFCHAHLRVLVISNKVTERVVGLQEALADGLDPTRHSGAKQESLDLVLRGASKGVRRKAQGVSLVALNKKVWISSCVAQARVWGGRRKESAWWR